MLFLIMNIKIVIINNVWMYSIYVYLVFFCYDVDILENYKVVVDKYCN